MNDSHESEIVARYGERVARALKDPQDHGRLVDRGKDAYDADEMLRYAAEDLLIRAGESVDRIDKSRTGFVEDHGEFELRRLKDARNVLAHGYDIVDPELVWNILATHLPTVIARVGSVLGEKRDGDASGSA